MKQEIKALVVVTLGVVLCFVGVIVMIFQGTYGGFIGGMLLAIISSVCLIGGRISSVKGDWTRRGVVLSAVGVGGIVNVCLLVVLIRPSPNVAMALVASGVVLLAALFKGVDILAREMGRRESVIIPNPQSE